MIEAIETFAATKQSLSVRQVNAQTPGLPGGEIPGLRPQLMAGAELRSAVNAALMLADSDDRQPLEAVRNLLTHDFGDVRGAREEALRDAGGVLLDWRKGTHTAGVAAEKIAALAVTSPHSDAA